MLSTDNLKEAVSLANHGLSNDEPLVLESIINSCYSNPDRKNFPEFLVEMGWSNRNALDKEHESAEYWLNLINPQLIVKFNQK